MVRSSEHDAVAISPTETAHRNEYYQQRKLHESQPPPEISFLSQPILGMTGGDDDDDKMLDELLDDDDDDDAIEVVALTELYEEQPEKQHDVVVRCISPTEQMVLYPDTTTSTRTDQMPSSSPEPSHDKEDYEEENEYYSDDDVASDAAATKEVKDDRISQSRRHHNEEMPIAEIQHPLNTPMVPIHVDDDEEEEDDDDEETISEEDQDDGENSQDDDADSQTTLSLLDRAHDRLAMQHLSENLEKLQGIIEQKNLELETLAGQLRRAESTKCDLVLAHTELERHHELDMQVKEREIGTLKACTVQMQEEQSSVEKDLLSEMVKLEDALKLQKESHVVELSELHKSHKQELDDWERLHRNEMLEKDFKIAKLSEEIRLLTNGDATSVKSNATGPVKVMFRR